MKQQSSVVRFVATLGTAMLLACASGVASATTFTSEAAFQAAASGFALDTFESYAVGTQLSSIPALGVTLDLLNDGTNHPSVQTHNSGFGGTAHSESQVLFNAVVPVLPGLGPIVLRPDSLGDVITAVGLWNTGGDDTVSLSFFDSSNILLESITSGFGDVFAGIVNATGAAKVVIDGVAGNGFFSIDDLQVQTVQTGPGVTVPEPGTILLFGSGLAALGGSAWRRQRRK